jgi:predicted aspartyl protease
MTRKSLFSLLAFWFSITLAHAGAVSLKIVERHILVEQVYVDGQGPFRFILDTGAQSSAIRTDVARKIGLNAVYQVETLSVGGRRYLPAAIVNQLRLGNQVGGGVEMVIHDLDAMKTVDPHVEGVLGQNFLAKFNYRLNLRGRQLSFDEAGDGVQIPFTRVADRMVLRSGNMSLVLDSGAGDLVLFHDPAGLKGAAEMDASAVSPAGKVRVGRLPILQVGERTLRNVRAAVIPGAAGGSDGLLPVTLFDSVYVNNAAGYVVVR